MWNISKVKNHSIDQQNFHFIIQQCEKLPPPQASLSLRATAGFSSVASLLLSPFAASFPPPQGNISILLCRFSSPASHSFTRFLKMNKWDDHNSNFNLIHI
jgi:hypothetical protein